MSKPETKNQKETKLSLNKKLETLDQKIEWFYSDDFSLDKSLENYQADLALTKEIETDLSTLKNKVEVLAEDFSKA